MKTIKLFFIIISAAIILVFITGCKESTPSNNKIKNISKSIGSKEEREAYIKFLNKQAAKMDTNSKFSLDTNDNTTLFLFRKSNLRPEDLGGNGQWIYLITTLTKKMNISEIKSKGFNKVRIYTNRSKNNSDYSLRIIP